jgi:hypothetical protein
LRLERVAMGGPKQGNRPLPGRYCHS